jgi:glycosyltransferase involved in cell wall biosynthesis
VQAAGLAQSWKAKVAHAQFQRMEKKAFRRARLLITNSERTKRDVIEHYGIDDRIIQPVYYGVDPALFFPASDGERQRLRAQLGLPTAKYLIVFVGALGDRRKGFDTLFEAWKIVRRENNDAELVVIGSGAELPRWMERAAKLPSGGGLRFLGFRSDVPAVLRASDALVAPARYEAFGIAALEALCCGLPVIVSGRAGIAERYKPSSPELLLDDPTDVVALTRALRRLLREKGSLAQVARQMADEFRRRTWQQMAAEMVARIER